MSLRSILLLALLSLYSFQSLGLFSEQFFKEIKRPVCNDCGNPIMGEYLWEFHGLYYCEDCLDNHKESIDIDYY